MMRSMIAKTAATVSDEQQAIQHTAPTECGERLPDVGKLWCILVDYDFDELDQAAKMSV